MGGLVTIKTTSGTASRNRYKVQSGSPNFCIRLRCAVNSLISIELDTHDKKTLFLLQKTFNSGEEKNLKYTNHNYVEVENTVVPGQGINPFITLQNVISIDQSVIAYIDRINFIPVYTTFEVETELETTKKAVNVLFIYKKDRFQIGVTYYEKNQSANLVECILDDLYPNEKRL
ncbi:delta endotoxin C-terminal domain-containing protein [Bacillus thuringiensis]|uniref:delta endotoxin C-terminal domain-containing protein n=1 Tax=Bacillus thuringiensis TaxID=1428 RepID=UPI0009765A8E|nr:delta endotoxin C-terminal domain-containing protein [Bacillus thuringiensis]MDY7522136.1 delta endotoxin C-terminal domain-containing protein [Bacillus thuringiensis]OMH25320.1 hypothetical protein BUM91_27970 [Bacillus thuringiensis]